MKVLDLHPWDVSPKEAIEIQAELRKRIVLTYELGEIQRVAGVDVAYSRHTDELYAAVMVFSYPDLRVVECRVGQGVTKFPYVPGLLAFREGPILLEVFKTIQNEPDLIMFDAQGIAHRRKMGLATHLGIILDKPSVGCAKSLLFGRCEEPANAVEATSWLEAEDKILGVSLRTRKDVKPVFVSVGHKIDLATAVKVVLSCCRGYRLPEPLRQAHIRANKLRQG